MLPTVYFFTCTKIVSNVTLYALAIKCSSFHGINLLLYVGIYLPEIKSISCQTWGSHTFLEFIQISWPAGQVPCIPPAEFTCKWQHMGLAQEQIRSAAQVFMSFFFFKPGRSSGASCLKNNIWLTNSFSPSYCSSVLLTSPCNLQRLNPHNIQLSHFPM